MTSSFPSRGAGGGPGGGAGGGATGCMFGAVSGLANVAVGKSRLAGVDVAVGGATRAVKQQRRHVCTSACHWSKSEVFLVLVDSCPVLRRAASSAKNASSSARDIGGGTCATRARLPACTSVRPTPRHGPHARPPAFSLANVGAAASPACLAPGAGAAASCARAAGASASLPAFARDVPCVVGKVAGGSGPTADTEAGMPSLRRGLRAPLGTRRAAGEGPPCAGGGRVSSREVFEPHPGGGASINQSSSSRGCDTRRYRASCTTPPPSTTEEPSEKDVRDSRGSA